MCTTVRVIRIIDRDEAIAGIAQIRQEWEDLAGDQSLIQVNGSVGLMLADIVQALGLTTEEQTQALGPDLAQEIYSPIPIQFTSINHPVE